MSQALYRKYRSKSLEDIVGQNHITDVLQRALKSDKVAHAYLFTGPRGVGKTSIARILAHEINQLPYTEDATHLDIIEIDAASNNGVEDVRDLREKVQIAPVSAAKKVYIIDEVHMLSKPAFNALLKTLEEPPEHVVFILATTDVEKLPATIISRTQRYGFKAIQPEKAVAHLADIAKKEGITISNEALTLIAERGDGSFRDSISLLDQLSSMSSEGEEITAQIVESILGLAPQSLVTDLMSATEVGDISTIASLLQTAEADGVNPLTITDQLIRYIRQQPSYSTRNLEVLDALLDVAKSPNPSAKLLTVLGRAYPHQEAALLPTPPTPRTAPPKSVALAAPIPEVSASVEELQDAKPIKKSASKKRSTKPTAPFDWQTLTQHTREHFVALHSVLSKCSPEVEGEVLTLYTVNAFYKKKLDDPKYSAHLYESLEAIGSSTLTVHTVPTAAPMKDSQAAAIAAMMGGGVEVSPETA